MGVPGADDAQGVRGSSPLRPTRNHRELVDSFASAPQVIAPWSATPCVEFGSGESSGFFDLVFPQDGQSKKRQGAGEDQPMAEGQGLPVE